MVEVKKQKNLPFDTLKKAKQQGFSDKQLAELTNRKENEIRTHRKKLGVLPAVKQIDTMAAEFPAKTNYLYLTYHGEKDDIDYKKKSARKKMVVLGSGPYAIGTSVEFDWCSVNSLSTVVTAVNFAAVAGRS